MTTVRMVREEKVQGGKILMVERERGLGQSLSDNSDHTVPTLLQNHAPKTMICHFLESQVAFRNLGQRFQISLLMYRLLSHKKQYTYLQFSQAFPHFPESFVIPPREWTVLPDP